MKKSLRISVTILTEYRLLACDGQTDTLWWHSPHYAYMSRDKKSTTLEWLSRRHRKPVYVLVKWTESYDVFAHFLRLLQVLLAEFSSKRGVNFRHNWRWILTNKSINQPSIIDQQMSTTEKTDDDYTKPTEFYRKKRYYITYLCKTLQS